MWKFLEKGPYKKQKFEGLLVNNVCSFSMEDLSKVGFQLSILPSNSQEKDDWITNKTCTFTVSAFSHCIWDMANPKKTGNQMFF